MRLRHLVVLPLLAGCYRYAPIEPTSAQPGSGVRARLTVDAGQRLAPLLGTTDNRLIAGRLIENRASGMIIEVPAIMSGSVGSSAQTLNQRISVAPSDLVELESRRLDRLRTGAVVGGGGGRCGRGGAQGARGREQQLGARARPGHHGASRAPVSIRAVTRAVARTTRGREHVLSPPRRLSTLDGISCAGSGSSRAPTARWGSRDPASRDAMRRQEPRAHRGRRECSTPSSVAGRPAGELPATSRSPARA